MQQPGILQPAEADSTSIGRRRLTEDPSCLLGRNSLRARFPWLLLGRAHWSRPLRGPSSVASVAPTVPTAGVCKHASGSPGGDTSGRLRVPPAVAQDGGPCSCLWMAELAACTETPWSDPDGHPLAIGGQRSCSCRAYQPSVPQWALAEAAHLGEESRTHAPPGPRSGGSLGLGAPRATASCQPCGWAQAYSAPPG
jgi:hypothetical protein